MTGAARRAVWRPAAPLADPSTSTEISRLSATQAAESDGQPPIPRLLREIAAHLLNLSELAEQLAEVAGNHLAGGRIQSVTVDVQGVAKLAPKEAPGSAPAQLLSVAQVAHKLGVSEPTIRRWRRGRVLPPAVEVAGIVRWRAEAIEKWIAEREEGTP